MNKNQVNAERNCRLYQLSRKGFVVQQDKRKKTRAQEKAAARRGEL